MSDTMTRHKRREFDVWKSFLQFVFPAIGAYFVVVGVFVTYARQITGPAETFQLVIPVGLVVGGVFLGLATRIQQRQMQESFMGYNVQDGSKPWFILGRREYTRYRIDNGTGQGMAKRPNRRRNRLQARERQQREMDCCVCQTTIGRCGGYFVETRHIYRVFGLIVWETILETDAYCPEHKPPEFQ